MIDNVVLLFSETRRLILFSQIRRFDDWQRIFQGRPSNYFLCAMKVERDARPEVICVFVIGVVPNQAVVREFEAEAELIANVLEGNKVTIRGLKKSSKRSCIYIFADCKTYIPSSSSHGWCHCSARHRYYVEN